MQTSSKATVLIIFAIPVIGMLFWLYPRAGVERAPLNHRELATRVMAEYLASHFAGQRAVIISNPFAQKKGQPPEIYAFEAAGIRGLNQGFGKSLAVEAVAFPDLRPEYQQKPDSVYVDPKTTTPLSYLIAEDAFDVLAKQHPACGLLVSLIGLPANLSRVELWRNPAGPKLALLLPDLRVIGDRTAIRSAVKSGQIAALVLNKPGAPAEDAPREKDRQAEFARRFLLVTPETVDELMRAYPKLF